MFKSSLALLTCVISILSFAGSSYADSAKSDEYHFHATLSQGKTSVRSVQLPWSVLSNMLQDKQRDLQVYNANDQAVPFAIRSVAVTKEAEQQTQPLNFFPMGDIEKLGTILQHEEDKQKYSTVKLLQTGQRYLIIDNPKNADAKDSLPLQSLTLNWQDLAHWLPKSLRVESSDDLTQWRTHAIEKLPYRMAEGGVVLENHELRFKQAVTARFIRLLGDEDFEPLLKSLKGVSGEYRRVSVTEPFQWNTVDLVYDKENAQFRYDLPPSIPLEQWRLQGLGSGNLYKGQLYTRKSTQRLAKPETWRKGQNFLQYALETEAGLITSEANAAAYLANTPEWRLDFEPPISEEMTPKLVLGWKPLELLFIAQGEGPFQIRYGSRTTQSSSQISLDGVLASVPPEVVEISEVNQLSVVESEDEATNYKYLLWGLLAAAVLMLLIMARGLLREMGS